MVGVLSVLASSTIITSMSLNSSVVEGGDNDGELRHTDPLLSGARLHVGSSLMRIRQYAKPVVV